LSLARIARLNAENIQLRVTEEAVYSSPRPVELCEELLKQEQHMKGSAAELLCGRGAMGRRKERKMAK
jgi:hypothetical protein